MAGKSRVYSVDTNIIVRYLLGEETELGKQSYNFFSDTQSGVNRIIILESIFAETVFILNNVYSVQKEKIADTLTGLLQYKGIINDDKKLLIQALELYKTTKLDIVDCILISKTRDKFQLMSFDKELNKIDSKYNAHILIDKKN